MLKRALTVMVACGILTSMALATVYAAPPYHHRRHHYHHRRVHHKAKVVIKL